jgi:3-hydroxy-9,10-secoandrosta-1,3,5(10)-triene-9,17-dione monooxygenase
VQRLCADAASTLDDLVLVLNRNMDELMTYAKRGEDAPIQRRVRFRFDSSSAADRSCQVVNSLFSASGGRAIFTSSPLLRCWLDVNAARAHFANNPEKPGRNFGGVQLELKNTDFFI